MWARESEQTIETGKSLEAPKIGKRSTFGSLITLHIQDMAEVGKAPLRSKAKTLDKLEATLGSVTLGELTRERLILFGKLRAKEGAGPVTWQGAWPWYVIGKTHGKRAAIIKKCR